MGRGRAPCCQKVGLNRGSWTPEEDMRLVAYIQKHGHGNWRALPKQAGLLRCGKSCRLRWINYLRPDIKRGNFTAEEEGTIIKLHGLLGNKWSKIASCLPGRTDNEIKNVWNTHLKKRVADDKEPKKKKSPTAAAPDHDQAPSSPSDSCYSDHDKPSGVDGADQEEKVEISVMEPSMDVLRMLEDSLSKPDTDVEPPPPKIPLPSSSSSTSSSITTCSDGMDILGEIPEIPDMEPELWDAIDDVFSSDVGVTEEAAAAAAAAGGHECSGEGRRWLAELERELDLWGGGSEVGHPQAVDQWDEREVDDPVSCYFQPSASWSPSAFEFA